MENERILPFAMLSTHLTKIDFHRENTKRITIDVTAKTINASYFHLFEDENKLIERKLLGQLEEVNEYMVDNSLIPNIIENIQLKTDSIKNSLVNEIDENFRGVHLNIFIELTPTKDKLLNITIKNMQLYLMFARYLKLLDFIMLDQSTEVPLPKYWKQMKGRHININYYSLIIEKYAYYYRNVGKPNGSLIIHANLLNSVITAPSSHTVNRLRPQVLAARGNYFNYRLYYLFSSTSYVNFH